MDEQINRLNENEKAFLKIVCDGLVECRQRKMVGEVVFKALYKDGGITDKWREVKSKER